MDFLQENATNKNGNLRGIGNDGGNLHDVEKHESESPAICEHIKQARRFGGLSCEAMFGKESKFVQTRPDECADTEGPRVAALCMPRISHAKPELDLKKIR